VNGIDLQVRRGEIYGFLGPNGSGKTTFIRMLCGLLTPDGGSGTCLGHDILRDQSLIKREVGYMTQRFSYYEDLSIRENLDFIARIYGIADRAGAVQRRASSAWASRTGAPSSPASSPGAGSSASPSRPASSTSAAAPPPGRAHRRRRPQGQAGILGRDPPALGRGDHDPRDHPLHGRGRALPPDRLPRLRQHPRPGHRGEVVRTAGLATWSVEGADLAALAASLRGQPGVEQVVPFGNTIHVSGHDGAALEATLSGACGPGRRRTRIESGLEDVFIGLMDGAKDNFS
jgi:ABC-2 type transport system ATP-binding protein